MHTTSGFGILSSLLYVRATCLQSAILQPNTLAKLCGSCRPNLLNLPQDLKGAILRHLQALGGAKAVVIMRLVSKSWQAAVEEFPAEVSLWPPVFKRLKEISKIIPNMRALTLHNVQEGLNLDSIAELGRLTELNMSQAESAGLVQAPILRFTQPFPWTLQSLQLQGLNVSPEVLRQGNLPYLTNLTFIWEQNGEAEAWQALLSLPKLKVQTYEQSRFKKREF